MLLYRRPMNLVAVALLSLIVQQVTALETCDGGCFLATIPAPRVCKCVQPRCAEATTDAQQLVHTLAAAMQGDASSAQTSEEFDYGCNVCKRRSMVYRTYNECMAGEKSFLPKRVRRAAAAAAAAAAATGPSGASSAADSLPKLLLPRANQPRLQAPGTCPPVPAAGCQAYTGWDRWEQLFKSAGPTTDVIVPAGRKVVLYGCAQPANAVTVRSISIPEDAMLAIADSPLTLQMSAMTVMGTFEMGSPDCPIQSGIEITIPGGVESNGINVLDSAKFDVHGLSQGPTWTRVSQTVVARSNLVMLQEPVQWQAGEDILLVTTLWKDDLVNQNEVLKILSISDDGRVIRTRQLIEFNHYGGEYQAEVALLSRRILFTTDDASLDGSGSIGPHLTLQTADARVTGAAFQKWGARNIGGRYPLHFHLVGNTTNAYLKNNVIYRSNWRCVTIHGTNGVYIYGNVGFDVHGHCYYLEDGVEERNILERNLAAYIHPIQLAGFSEVRYASSELFDPTDAGAAGFYSLNKYNTWLNNAASGGVSGFTFPRAPRPIKESRYAKEPDGLFPMSPGRRPFILFKGNSAHSSAWVSGFSACVYFGGVVYYAKDPADSQVKLFYFNGNRMNTKPADLCPDPLWPAFDKENAGRDCISSSGNSVANGGVLELDDVTTALCAVGVNAWSGRIAINKLKAYDVNKAAFLLDNTYIGNSHVKINTTNSAMGWSGWPYTSIEYFRDSYWTTGFNFYDSGTVHMLDNVTFENYKYLDVPADPKDGYQEARKPVAISYTAWSDKYKPSWTQAMTRKISCINCDLGTATSPRRGAFFKIVPERTSANWFFTLLDYDGSMARIARPDKAAGTYLIASSPTWWNLGPDSWQEPAYNGAWINNLRAPWPNVEMVARLDMRVVNQQRTSSFTVSVGDDGNHPAYAMIGYVSQFGDTTKQVILTKNEGTLGMTGNTGWYVVWNVSTSSYHAPKVLVIATSQIPEGRFVLWTSCYPPGTTFAIKKKAAHYRCLDQVFTPTSTRYELLQGGGHTYWVDSNGCLHLKITDYIQETGGRRNFQYNGLFVDFTVSSVSIEVVATGPAMTADGCSEFWCPLPGDPAVKVPAPVAPFPLLATCPDMPPPGKKCTQVLCAEYPPEFQCAAPSLQQAGYCQKSCNYCSTTAATMLSVVPRMVVRETRNRYTCVVRLTVTDNRGGLLGPGISVSGIWSKFPDPSATDMWPYSATVSTRNGSVATLVAKSTLSKRIATTCAFSIVDVNAASWMASKGTTAGGPTSKVEWSTSAVAKACWDSSGKVSTSCP